MNVLSELETQPPTVFMGSSLVPGPSNAGTIAMQATPSILLH